LVETPEDNFKAEIIYMEKLIFLKLFLFYNFLSYRPFESGGPIDHPSPVSERFNLDLNTNPDGWGLI
jgi:hypothetical protein